MNWPWSRNQAPASPPPPADEQLTETALERLQRLEAAFSQLQVEWGDTLDKIGRHFSRQAARERQRLHRDLGALETAEDAPQATNGDPSHSTPPGDAKARLRAAVNAQRLRRA